MRKNKAGQLDRTGTHQPLAWMTWEELLQKERQRSHRKRKYPFPMTPWFRPVVSGCSGPNSFLFRRVALSWSVKVRFGSYDFASHLCLSGLEFCSLAGKHRTRKRERERERERERTSESGNAQGQAERKTD